MAKLFLKRNMFTFGEVNIRIPFLIVASIDKLNKSFILDMSDKK